MKVVIEESPWSKSNPGSPKSGDSPGWGSGDFAQQHTRLFPVQGAWNDSHFKGIFIPYRGKSDGSFPNRESFGLCILLKSFCDAVSLRRSMVVGRKVFDHVKIPCPTFPRQVYYSGISFPDTLCTNLSQARTHQPHTHDNLTHANLSHTRARDPILYFVGVWSQGKMSEG